MLGWWDDMDKFEACLKLINLILTTANKLDLNVIRSKHSFTKKRVIKMHIQDADKAFTFRFTESGGLKLCLMMPPKPDVHIYISELCILKHIRNGYISGYEPGTMTKINIDYSPLDAWKFGDVYAEGDASTNDVLASVNILLDVMINIPQEDINRIIGDCEHD